MVYMKKMKAIITTFIEYICHLSKYPKGNMVKLAGTYSRHILYNTLYHKNVIKWFWRWLLIERSCRFI